MIIKIAKLFLNTPYEFWWEGKLPWDPTDCSNFTQNILSQVGINLERASFQQKEQFVNAKAFYEDIKKAEIGDLIFFKNTYESENEITHVGIYAWDNTMIHAWTPKVAVVNLAGYRRSHFKVHSLLIQDRISFPTVSIRLFHSLVNSESSKSQIFRSIIAKSCQWVSQAFITNILFQSLPLPSFEK